MKRIGFITAAMALVMLAASAVLAEDEVLKRAQGMFKPVPATVPEMKGKAFTPAKVALSRTRVIPQLGPKEFLS